MISSTYFKTFFETANDRTIDKLAEVYMDMQCLYESIKSIMLPVLTPEDIKGKSILLKPNFVLQNRKPTDPICLFTHPNVIFATLRVLLECNPKQITIGDAPVQNCDWNLMLDQSFYDEIDNLSRKFQTSIKVTSVH